MREDVEFVYYVFGGFAAFKVANGLISTTKAQSDFGKVYSVKGQNMRKLNCPSFHMTVKGSGNDWKWTNTATSFVHSTIIGLWSLLVVLLNYHLLVDLRVEATPPGSHALVCVTLGYFIFDAYDLASNTFDKFSTKALLLHHLAVSSAFALGAVTQNHLYSLAVALLTEVNSAFLHLRTLLKLNSGPDGVKATLGYRAVAFMNIVTFFTCRLLVFLWLGMKLQIIKDSVDPGVIAMFWAGLVIVAIISVIHFRRLIISDFFTPSKPSHVNKKE